MLCVLGGLVTSGARAFGLIMTVSDVSDHYPLNIEPVLTQG